MVFEASASLFLFPLRHALAIAGVSPEEDYARSNPQSFGPRNRQTMPLGATPTAARAEPTITGTDKSLRLPQPSRAIPTIFLRPTLEAHRAHVLGSAFQLRSFQLEPRSLLPASRSPLQRKITGAARSAPAIAGAEAAATGVEHVARLPRPRSAIPTIFPRPEASRWARTRTPLLHPTRHQPCPLISFPVSAVSNREPRSLPSRAMRLHWQQAPVDVSDLLYASVSSFSGWGWWEKKNALVLVPRLAHCGCCLVH